jgi:NADH-quinone oxidoreductase subunit J
MPGPGVYASADSADQRPVLPGDVSGLVGAAQLPGGEGDETGGGNGSGNGDDPTRPDTDTGPGVVDGSAPVGAGKGSGL